LSWRRPGGRVPREQTALCEEVLQEALIGRTPQSGSNVTELGQEVAPAAQRRGRRWMVLAVTLLVAALLAPLVVLSLRAYRLRNANLLAMADVVAAGRALQQLGNGTAIGMTIIGPGVVPVLHGAEVSAGTTLFLRRWRNGTVYVRGSHQDGDAIYYFSGDGFYVAAKLEATAEPHG
jgi:hypothetical protein